MTVRAPTVDAAAASLSLFFLGLFLYRFVPAVGPVAAAGLAARGAELLEKLLAGNRRFAEDRPERPRTGADRRATLTSYTSPSAMCSSARTMAARLGLSAALHIHAGTGRWAGPSRGCPSPRAGR